MNHSSIRFGVVAVALLGAVAALSACNKAADTAATTPAPAETAAAPAATAPEIAAPAPTTAPMADPAVAAESLGIPACDDYLTKYQACITGKVPEASRAALAQSLAMTRDGWKQAIAAGGGAQLGDACKQMQDQARASLQAYGCTDF